MILNLIVLALVALVAYLWSIKGFFSSFLHMVCVIIAGAVAFGVWEPASIMVLNMAPTRGPLASLSGNAWGIGLLLPFAVSLLLLRVVTDKFIRANVNQATLVNYIGGGACGVVSGILAVGIMVIGFGSFRFTDSTMGMGYKPIWHTSERATKGGSLVDQGGLWVPADKLTGMFYGHLSQTSFYAPEPLSKWHPQPHLEGPSARLTYNDGATRNTLRPRDVEFRGLYIVGKEDGTSPANELLIDSFTPDAQKYVNIKGEPVPTGKLLGVKFELGSEAKESTGQHMISPGQLRLLVEPLDAAGRPTGEPSINIFPVALISQGDSAVADSFGRWRFDAEGLHVSSVGGGSSALMSAEFLVPARTRPIALYVKNTRLRLDNVAEEPARFGSVSMRDAQIRAGSILRSARMTTLDRSRAVRIGESDISGRGGETAIVVSTRLGMQRAFQTAQKRSLDLDANRRITSGVGSWTPAEVSRGRDIAQNLKVDRFYVPDGTLMVQVDVGPGSAGSLLGEVGRNAGANDAYYLIDTQGTAYQAIGYIYEDKNRYDIRYLPGQPINGVADLAVPGLSGVRDDQKLTLLFAVSRGVQLQSFVIGDKVVFELDKPRLLDDRVD